MANPKKVAFEDSQWMDWPLPTKGLSKDVDPEVMPPDFWASLQNAVCEYGVTKKVGGFEAIQASAADLDLGAPVMLIAEVEDSAKFPTAVFGTARNLWRYDPDNDVLAQIDRYSQGSIAVTNGSDQVVGTDTVFLSHVKAGDIVTVDDGIGGTYTATVGSVEDDLNLTLSADWSDPTDLTVDLTLSGNYIEQIFSINGIWDWTVYQGGDVQPYLYLTNGIDPIIRWTPEGTLSYVEILGGDPPKCYFITSFREFLILGYLTDNGSGISLPLSLAWPKAGQPTNWIDGEQRTLAEGTDAIVGMEILGNRLVIHREESQNFLEFRGGTFIFYTGEINRGAGGIGKRSVIAIKNGHLVVGDENLFIHSTQDLHNIGDMTVQQWLVNNIHPAYQDTVQMLYVPEDNRVYIFFPSLSAGGNYCDKALIFNTLEGSFAEMDVPSVTAAGTFREFEKIFIDDVTDIIDTVTALIDAVTPLTFLATVVIGTDTGKIYSLTGLNDFDGTGITVTIESGQDVLGDKDRRKNITKCRFDLEADAGTVINFYIGTKNESHQAFTWNGPYVIPITGVSEVIIPHNIGGRYLARRFISSVVDGNFTIRKMSVLRSIEGEY